MRDAFIEQLLLSAAADRRIWLVTGDLGYSVLEPFAERFPARFINAGVAEQNMTGVAAGLALSGNIVFTYSIANFATMRPLEQLRNDVCYHGLPVIAVAIGGGFAYGTHGYTHHAIEDLAIMRALPGMTVAAPGDPVETRLVVSALIAAGRPAYLRLGKAGEQIVHKDAPAYVLGRALEVRPGRAVTFAAIGGALPIAVTAADLLAQEGVDSRVLSIVTLRPLDITALASALDETAGVVLMEEHRSTGGLASAVGEAAIGTDLDMRRVRSLALPAGEHFGTGSQTHLRSAAGLTASAAVALARKLLG